LSNAWDRSRNVAGLQFYGIDICEDAIQTATNGALEKSLSNAHFVKGDALQLPSDWSSKFAYATITVSLHDIPFPNVCLQEIIRVLKPGGMLSVIEVSASSNVYENIGTTLDISYVISLFHCMAVTLNFPGGSGLGTACGNEKLTELLKAADFDEVKEIDSPWDKNSTHYLCVKSKVHG